MRSDTLNERTKERTSETVTTLTFPFYGNERKFIPFSISSYRTIHLITTPQSTHSLISTNNPTVVGVVEEETLNIFCLLQYQLASSFFFGGGGGGFFRAGMMESKTNELMK